MIQVEVRRERGRPKREAKLKYIAFEPRDCHVTALAPTSVFPEFPPAALRTPKLRNRLVTGPELVYWFSPSYKTSSGHRLVTRT